MSPSADEATADQGSCGAAVTSQVSPQLVEVMIGPATPASPQAATILLPSAEQATECQLVTGALVFFQFLAPATNVAVVVINVLLFVSGSGVSAIALTTLVPQPASVASAWMLILVVLWQGRAPIAKRSVDPFVAGVGVAEMKLNPVGKRLLTMTPPATPGPLFSSLKLNVYALPGVRNGGAELSSSARSVGGDRYVPRLPTATSRSPDAEAVTEVHCAFGALFEVQVTPELVELQIPPLVVVAMS